MYTIDKYLTDTERLSAIAEGFSSVLSDSMGKTASAKDLTKQAASIDMGILGKAVVAAIATGVPLGIMWDAMASSVSDDDESIAKLKAKRRFFQDRSKEISSTLGQ